MLEGRMVLRGGKTLVEKKKTPFSRRAGLVAKENAGTTSDKFINQCAGARKGGESREKEYPSYKKKGRKTFFY